MTILRTIQEWFNGKRILPEDVVAAYKKSGLKPVCHVFTDPSNTKGCAIAALYFPSLRPLSMATKDYGYSYTQGFITGYDGNKLGFYDKVNKRAMLGFYDGTVARNLMKPEDLNDREGLLR